MDNNNNDDQFQIKTNIKIYENNPDIKISDNAAEQNELPSQSNNLTTSLHNNSLNGRIKVINNNKTNKPNTLLFQEKLKNIFLEREKAKFKYNKHNIPEQLKYNSDDEESNISKETNNNNNQNINQINEKENKRTKECKSFRMKDNHIKNDEIKKEKNLYQLLLTKKLKNINEDDSNEEKKKNENNKKIKKELSQELEIKNQNDDEVKIEKEEKKDDKNQKMNKIEEEKNQIEKKEETVKKEEKNIENSDTKKVNPNNEFNNILEIIKDETQDKKNIDNKTIEINNGNKRKYSTKTYCRNIGVIQLNQNLNIEKNNMDEGEKGTDLPEKQKNRLTINLENKQNIKNDKYKKGDDNNNSSKDMSTSKNSKVELENSTINIKIIKDDEKSNIMKLLKLIKSKKNEKERICKEKEKVKEEMSRRAKSLALSRNVEEKQIFNNSNIDINIQNIEDDNNISKKNDINSNKCSSKKEIYKKNKINNNKCNSNYKKNEKLSINIKKNEIDYKIDIEDKSPKCVNNFLLSKKNSSSILCYKNKNNKFNKIFSNQQKTEKSIQNDVCLNETNINFKNYNNKNFFSNADKNELSINIKKSNEKPVFIYNKSHLPNKSVDIDNLHPSNIANKKANCKKQLNHNINNDNNNNIHNLIKIYNPKKPQDEKVKNLEKYSEDNNNKANNDNSKNNNYIYNYNNNNYLSNNNNNDINGIYFKKKSSLIESNIETNTSSCNLSKSIINNYERNKQNYLINNNIYNNSINNNMNNNLNVCRVGHNYYSMIPPKNNQEKRMNLKINKKSLHLRDNNLKLNIKKDKTDIQCYSDLSEINNISNENNLNRNKSINKFKNNSVIKNYSTNISCGNDVSNNNHNIHNYNKRKLGLQKYTKKSKDIMMILDGEEQNRSLHNFINLNFIDSNNANDVNNMSTQRKNKKNKIFNLFKIEDLLVIEEKLNVIVECLQNNKEICKQSFDLWNFYFNSSIFNKIEKIFEFEDDINIVKLCINCLLISIIVCYEYSLGEDIFIETNFKLLEIMELNYNNLMGLFRQIINFINDNDKEKDNIWVKKVFNIFENYTKKEDFFVNNGNILLSLEQIINNNDKINLKIHNLLNYYQTENNTLLLNYFLQLKTKKYEDLNIFFQKNILQIENEEGSLIASLYLRNNSPFTSLPPPYIKTTNKKKYSLVLDLDETLVNFKIKNGKEGYVRLRPFLFGFLEEVSQFYELIIFSSASEAYANSVIEAIEHDKKYFDYVFYRQHTIIVGNDFVKDLTRIGRPLNSIIIIDNMPQNFRFQKENGICIKPFWGQDSNDKTLYNLMPILIDIAKIGGDVRVSLNKYREEIVGKISSNILKNKN